MSKRQDTLFKRMKSAKERYTKSKNELNGLLLKRLHNDGVYTPDQFDKTYITRKEAIEYAQSQTDKNNEPISSQNYTGDEK